MYSIVSPTNQYRMKAQNDLRQSYLENFKLNKIKLKATPQSPIVWKDISEDMIDRNVLLAPLHKSTKSQLSKIKEKLPRGNAAKVKKSPRKTEKSVELPNIYHLRHILARNEEVKEKRAMVTNRTVLVVNKAKPAKFNNAKFFRDQNFDKKHSKSNLSVNV